MTFSTSFYRKNFDLNFPPLFCLSQKKKKKEKKKLYQLQLANTIYLYKLHYAAWETIVNRRKWVPPRDGWIEN